jgi:putative oxidoreductase
MRVYTDMSAPRAVLPPLTPRNPRPVSPRSLRDPDHETKDTVLSILRIVVGFLFICHGASKLFGVLGGSMGSGKPAQLGSLLGLSGVIEFFGGILLLVGLATRVTAFIMAGEMAVAYFKVHLPRGPWPLTNRGEIVVVYCFLLLYLAVAGSGPLALDHVIANRRKTRAPSGTDG